MAYKVRMIYGGSEDSANSGSGGGTGSTNITNVSASASTLAAGSPATAAASLTDDSLTLTFGIPQGIQGERGEQGETGPQGEPGTSAVLGAAYSGTYTGTGTYGSANPNTLSFTTPPSTVIITRDDSTGFAAQMVLQQGSEQAVFTSTNTSNTYHRVNKVTWSNDGKTVSWYCTQDAGAQCNESGESYTFVAIGTGEIACTVDVGTVTTGAAGSQAAVTNSGTSQQAVFNFTIPAGATGPQGPKGDIGETGATGPAGAAATIAIGTVTTGAEGSQATVTNSGTPSAAVFDFSIPVGATGATGPTGPRGETGDTGPQGPPGATGNGISSITLVSTVGKVKTYRITMTDGSTFDFTVTDGADGTGSGDMEKAVYDTDDNGVVDEAESVSNVSGTGAIEFGLDADGKGQYRAVGAATWIPFLSSPTYTRLWTNSSPSSSFAAQTVSLSDAASNYDMLRIVWARINTAGVTESTWESSTDALACLYDMTHATSLIDATNRLCMDCAVRPGTGYYARRCWFTSSACTAVEFGTTTRWGASGTNNALVIPILIDGVNFNG